MSDTAEYWWDVKNSSSGYYHVMTHIEGCECGRKHKQTTKLLREVDCNKCKKIFAEMGNIFDLDVISRSQQKELDKQAREKNKCSCGAQMKIRTNSVTQKQFKGCSRYPHCKITKEL